MRLVVHCILWRVKGRRQSDHLNDFAAGDPPPCAERPQLDPTPVRGLTSERTSKSLEVDRVNLLERCFTFRVLFEVVIPAQADAPPIGRLESRSTIRSTPNMSAFDVSREAAGYAAVMSANPGAVRRTLALREQLPSLAFEHFWKTCRAHHAGTSAVCLSRGCCSAARRPEREVLFLRPWPTGLAVAADLAFGTAADALRLSARDM